MMGMATPNLFHFDRPLPPPFDKLPNKKVKGAASHYGGTEATLCAPVIKAVHAFCGCRAGEPGAVGSVTPDTFVAEYKSSAGPETYHLVVYDSSTGGFFASVYDKNTELLEQYCAHANARDGAALFFAMMPLLLKDQEFQENFFAYEEQLQKGYPDLSEATHRMAVLCDNVYRRVRDSTCPAHVPVRIDKSGNLMRVTRTQLDSGTYWPATVTAGEFTIFSQKGHREPPGAKAIPHGELVGQYVLTPGRDLSPREKALVPTLPEWYQIPPEVVDICKHAKLTTGKPTQMRNFLLRGPAGTGKTMGAKAIAAGLGLPYVKYTCSAETEIYDFVGTVFPNTNQESGGSAQLDQEREQLQAMGGITYENVSRLLELPGLEDMEYDPAGVYRALTGEENQNATTQDCMKLALEQVTDKVRQLSAPSEGAPAYTYVETDFIRALKNGYLVEIQEPSTILQPGVLVGLNSLLEQGGAITLPTGKVMAPPPGRCGGGHHQHQLRGLPGHQPKRSGPHEPDQGHGASHSGGHGPAGHGGHRRRGRVPSCSDGSGGKRAGGVLPEKRHHRRLRGNAGPHRLDRQRPDFRRPLHLRSGHGDLQSRRGRGGPGSIDHRGAGTGVRPPPDGLRRWTMARVNHKRVKQLIQEKQGKITDQEFFTSRLLAIHLEDLAAAQTRRYGVNRRVRVCLVWQPDRDDLAFTDNLTITLNPGHPAITQFPTRGERYQMVCGLFAHELGHCLYTDFLAQQTYRNSLANGRWYPSPPELYRIRDVKTERELWEYAQKEPENLVLLGRVALGIGNVLEDAVVENKVLEEFPGTLGQALGFVRAWQWREMPTVTQLKELEALGTPMFYSLLQLFLSYGKYGELKYGEEPLSEAHIQTMFELLPLLDQDLQLSDSRMRWNTVNQILICCWEQVRDYLEALKGLWKDSGKQGTVFAQFEAELSALVGSSVRAEGDTSPVAAAEETPSLPQPGKREATRALAAGTSIAQPASGKQESVPEKTGPRPLAETNQVSEPLGSGATVREDYVPELSKTMEREMEQLLENMAEITVCRELEQDRLGELNREGSLERLRKTGNRLCPV